MPRVFNLICEIVPTAVSWMISGRHVLGTRSRSQMILIETFSPSRGRGLSKIAQFASFAVFTRFNAVLRD